MNRFIEGNLQITIPAKADGRKFDDETVHGLTHCMKAVDFVIELKDRYLFVEVKDPEDPRSQPKEREKFVQKFLAGGLDEDLKYKYRDSFLYEWASQRARKPIYFLVLVAIESLTKADLLTRTDALKRKMPLQGPPSGEWKNQLVEDIAVFNISTWNEKLKEYPVKRLLP